VLSQLLLEARVFVCTTVPAVAVLNEIPCQVKELFWHVDALSVLLYTGFTVSVNVTVLSQPLLEDRVFVCTTVPAVAVLNDIPCHINELF